MWLTEMKKKMSERNAPPAETNRFYRLAAIAMTCVVLLTLTDLVFGTMTAGFAAVPETAVGRFEEFESSVVMGLYHLDLLNMVINSLTAIGFLGLSLAHLKERPLMTGFAVLLFIAGLLVFISNNTALPMMTIASRYNESTDAVYRAALSGAGEALLARGEHGSPAMFLCMSFMVTAGIIVSWQMLKGSLFKSAAGVIGLISNSSLLIYLILMAFVPGVEGAAMLIVAPGGILAIVWQVLVARKFYLLVNLQR